jgi:hypothetical protein
VRRTTAHLDASRPDQLDAVVDAVASMVTDSPGATRVFVLDASNDTAGYDWLLRSRRASHRSSARDPRGAS